MRGVFPPSYGYFGYFDRERYDQTVDFWCFSSKQLPTGSMVLVYMLTFGVY